MEIKGHEITTTVRSLKEEENEPRFFMSKKRLLKRIKRLELALETATEKSNPNGMLEKELRRLKLIREAREIK